MGKSAPYPSQTDNDANIPPLNVLQAGCPSGHPTNSIKALKAESTEGRYQNFNMQTI